jgi:hypothetical protein
MPSYLQRYLDGEREAVWAELMALGPSVRDEPLFTDARAVARETMTRARANVETLVERLTALGYRFRIDASGEARTPHIPPSPESLASLREIEAEYGPLPLAIEMWHEVVGAVDLMGAYPRLSSCDEVDPRDLLLSFQGQSIRMSVLPEFRILGPAETDLQPDKDPVSDPLVVWPCIEDLVDEEDGAGEDEASFSLCIAPDALHKANISGGDGPHIAFGDASMDAPMTGDDWDGMPFVPYLRIAFAWGGFPGLRDEPNPPRDLLAYLCEGLQPL